MIIGIPGLAGPPPGGADSRGIAFNYGAGLDGIVDMCMPCYDVNLLKGAQERNKRAAIIERKGTNLLTAAVKATPNWVGTYGSVKAMAPLATPTYSETRRP
jgi:hypothetical protein